MSINHISRFFRFENLSISKVFLENNIIGGKRMSYMKRSISVFIACFMVAALGISGIIAPKASAASQTPVAVNGQLTLKGTQLGLSI